MLDFVPYCYTVENSVGMFRGPDMKDNCCFGPHKWEEAGAIIGESLKESVEKIEKDMCKKKKKKYKINNIQKK